jgi:chemotaxis response regulator CheB
MIAQAISKPKEKIVLKVLIVNDDRLLGAAIASLLNKESDMELLGVTPTSTPELIATTRKLRPNIIILDNLHPASKHIPQLLTAAADISDLCVIVVNADQNLLTVFSVHQHLVEQWTDLVNVIRAEPARPQIDNRP